MENAPRGTRPPQVAAQDDELTPSQRGYLDHSLKLGEMADKRDDFMPPNGEEVLSALAAPGTGPFVDDTSQFTRVELDGSFVDDTNPKDLIGITKPNLFLVPPSAQIYMALAMQDGAAKYGPYNWREKKVKASIYIAATLRHIAAWVDGEPLTGDSKTPHLGNALASLGILVDAIETGNLVDDRPPAGAAPELIAHWTKDKNVN